MGPLNGLKVIELGGIGPCPFTGMLLADMGAEVVSVSRPGERLDYPVEYDVVNRGKRPVTLDLKSPHGVRTVLAMVKQADILIEGFRPGVAERLGLGPEECAKANPRLVYGRVTGWGQEGPLAQAAGHDLNYIALTGALHSIGRKDGPPAPPLNLIGDYGGGALYLAFGVLCALHESKASGKGQVVDAAMVDGAASLMTMFYALNQLGLWSDRRGANYLDSGAYYYDVYETRDGRHVSVATVEAKFHAEMLQRIGWTGELPSQDDQGAWDEVRRQLQDIFVTRTMDEWCALLEGTDACFAPVLTMSEAARHPHSRARNAFIELAGVRQPAPAPRFSRSRTDTPAMPRPPGADSAAVLRDWGIPAEAETPAGD